MKNATRNCSGNTNSQRKFSVSLNFLFFCLHLELCNQLNGGERPSNEMSMLKEKSTCKEQGNVGGISCSFYFVRDTSFYWLFYNFGTNQQKKSWVCVCVGGKSLEFVLAMLFVWLEKTNNTFISWNCDVLFIVKITWNEDGRCLGMIFLFNFLFTNEW